MAHFWWPGAVAGAVRCSSTSWVSNAGRQDHAICKINHPKETFSALSGSEWQACM